MKKRFCMGFAILLMMVAMLQMTVSAAGETVTAAQCYIAGTDVYVNAAGPVAQSDTGMYYLFELKVYETGVGARQDFCAAVPAAEIVQFQTPLNYNTANSKLTSRFVITAYRGGMFVPVSNEIYITNPEALAKKALGNPAKSKKGLIADWQYVNDLKDLNVGYATYTMDINTFFAGSGVNYTYNGKTYSFNASQVAAYDVLCKMFTDAGTNVVMVLTNDYQPATADLVPAAARIPNIYNYSFNIQEQIPAEKLEALLSFLASRYNGGSYGAIHSWIIGNEVNNNYPGHYAGNMGVTEFSVDYAKQFRVMYNAIKSHNSAAKVYINIDQRWNYEDGTPNQYSCKSFLNNFASYVKTTGDINWGLSFHPHAVPMTNCQFWNVPLDYARMRLIDNTENSKFITMQNMHVMTDYMQKPEMLNPVGMIRDIIISEIGFTSTGAYVTNEQIQAAAMVYAYKIADQLPIQAFIVHKHVDAASEALEGLAYGLRTPTYKKYAYEIFKYMDTGNSAYTDFALPIIGASSWAQLGVK